MLEKKALLDILIELLIAVFSIISPITLANQSDNSSICLGTCAEGLRINTFYCLLVSVRFASG
jgi:hypothetical protein